MVSTPTEGWATQPFANGQGNNRKLEIGWGLKSITYPTFETETYKGKERTANVIMFLMIKIQDQK